MDEADLTTRYHGTSRANAESIMQLEELPRGFYVARDLDYARKYAHGMHGQNDPVVLELRLWGGDLSVYGAGNSDMALVTHQPARIYGIRIV